MLHYPDPTKDFQIRCDASSMRGLGAVLLQDGRPLYYWSRSLHANEANWHITELECISIVSALKKFQRYIYGHKVTVFTDHGSLAWLLTSRNLLNGKLYRWSIFLSSFNLSIVYVKGSLNFDADFLSRNPLIKEAVEQAKSKNPRVMVITRNMAKQNDNADVMDVDLKENADKSLNQVDNEISVQNLPDTRVGESVLNEIQPGELLRWQLKDFECVNFLQNDLNIANDDQAITNLKLINMDVIMFENRIFVPEFFRSMLLHRTHKDAISGHQGSSKMMAELANFYWPKMALDIREYCMSCEWCIAYKHPKRNKFVMTRTPARFPFEIVAIDVLHLTPEESEHGDLIGKVLVVADTFSSYVRIAELIDESAENMKNALVKCFSTFPIPMTIIADNAGVFKACEVFIHDMAAKAHKLVNIHYTTPYLHRSNPVERLNRTILDMIRVTSNYTGDWRMSSWLDTLHAVEYCINHSAMDSSRLSPVDLINVTNTDSIKDKYVSDVELEYINGIVEDRVRVVQTLRVLKYARRIKATANANGSHLHIVNIGDTVLYFDGIKRGKLDCPASGPYSIVAMENGKIKLQMIDNKSIEFWTTPSMVKRLVIDKLNVGGMLRNDMKIVHHNSSTLLSRANEHMGGQQTSEMGYKGSAGTKNTGK
eukprot:NODE_544_length_6231_cov_0.089693.p2 type:complete len:653 gc:universal NODE_544_length_6231_cov_0.089693:3347-1389(-)